MWFNLGRAAVDLGEKGKGGGLGTGTRVSAVDVMSAGD
jgi:hypothetical protein